MCNFICTPYDYETSISYSIRLMKTFIIGYSVTTIQLIIFPQVIIKSLVHVRYSAIIYVLETKPVEIDTYSGESVISQTRGANPSVWSKNLLFDTIFAENCINMKEIGLRRGGCYINLKWSCLCTFDSSLIPHLHNNMDSKDR